MFKFYQEFKEFAVKGNMIDIAVGVIIGAAFNKVIDVIVKQILMPPLSLMTSGLHFSTYKWILRDEITGANGEIVTQQVAIGFGALCEAAIDFVIIAFTVFIIIKGMNRLRNRAQDVQDKKVVTPKDIELLDKISLLLEEQNALLSSKNKL
jgi:large conductance mechanosensitive channel